MPQRDASDVDGFEVGRDGPDPPARADGRSWSDHVRQRCFVLWCDTGRNASRVAQLYRQGRPDDTPGPAPSTIRRWGAQEQWKLWAGEEVPPLRGESMDQWRTMWFRQVTRQVETALTTQRGLLLGTFDGDPAATAEALATADATMTDLLAQPGVRALLRASFREESAPSLSLPERERHVRTRLRQQHGGR